MAKIMFVIKEIGLVERVGIMYLSANLKKHGHAVALVRALGGKLDPAIESFQPDIIAYSSTTGAHKFYLDLNRKLKTKYRYVSLLGGPHPTFFPQVLNEPGLDAICVGEGEEAIVDVADRIDSRRDLAGIPNIHVKQDGAIQATPVRPLVEDLDTLPFPDRELYYQESPLLRNYPVKVFFAGRGCPYKCSYCFNHKFNLLYRGKGPVIRKRNPECVVEEILQLKSRVPLGCVQFEDDTFLLGGNDWLASFAGIYRRKVNLPYVCNVRADLVTAETARLLAEGGCHAVYMAIEAGNDQIRNNILRRNLSKEQLINAARLLHDVGINVESENLVALPGETLANIWETIDLNIACKVDAAIPCIFTPYPGTDIAQYSIDHGYFDGNFERIEPSYFTNIMLNFTPKEKKMIFNLQQWFELTVAFPWLKPLTRQAIKLPRNRVFKLIHDLWHGYRLKTKIFPFRVSPKLLWPLIKFFCQRHSLN